MRITSKSDSNDYIVTLIQSVIISANIDIIITLILSNIIDDFFFNLQKYKLKEDLVITMIFYNKYINQIKITIKITYNMIIDTNNIIRSI